ncbi:hypothetical protein K2173_007924 [Erythroxylum novogranatense]|uniref:Uncharacterized protein n=1 Tax=Erythroxylum novogranatense TaxID=1862640 RepID=A0AAV8T890_9ROSI|nr:hypothetical protein K2173_007924 [Erythroxylum novogranatense]
MKTKGHSRSKFMRIVTLPLKVLGKARDYYVRSLTDCSMSISHGHTMALPNGQFSSMPRSFSVRSSMSEESEDYRELVRAASVRSLGHKSEMELLYMQELMKASKKVGSQSQVLPKSSSVGMGRIDEDAACNFEEIGARKVAYPRSRSYAVGKPNVMF